MSRDFKDYYNPDKKTGRPSKAEPPRIPFNEVDRLLVFGEVVKTNYGKNTTVIYPTHRELARRFGVSHSVISAYARKYNCAKRRKDAFARVAMKADQKLIEARSTAIAVSKDDSLRIIDTYLVGFEKAMSEDRVRFDNPSDFNMMVRLKEFIQGGADSRQEIHAALSLEDLQTRHKQMLRVIEESSAKERGEVGVYEPAAILASNPVNQLNPPPDSSKKVARKVSGQFSEISVDSFDGQFSRNEDDNSPDSPSPSPDMAAYVPEEDWDDNTSSNSDEADTGASDAPIGEGSQSADDSDYHTVNKSSDTGLSILSPAPDDEDER